jgi:hypothetical protein
MIIRTSILCWLVSLLVFGCAGSSPAVRMESAEPLRKYRIFEVAPVSNETGKTFAFDIAEEFENQIRSQLESKGYIVAADPGGTDDALIIRCSITSYEPGSAFARWLAPGAGKTQATVLTSMVDKRTGSAVGEMLSADAVGAGGLYTIGADRWILEKIAKGVVEKIEERMKK